MKVNGFVCYDKKKYTSLTKKASDKTIICINIIGIIFNLHNITFDFSIAGIT